MADLLVRGVDDALVRELKKRAGAHGRSAEAEHRAILAAALLNPPRLHDLTLVTRNTRDFAATGVRLRNPFVA